MGSRSCGCRDGDSTLSLRDRLRVTQHFRKILLIVALERSRSAAAYRSRHVEGASRGMTSGSRTDAAISPPGQSRAGLLASVPVLVRSLEDVVDLAAGQRRGVLVLQFAPGESGDRSFLITGELVGERARLDTKADDLRRLVDGVGAEVADRAAHDGFGFLRRRVRRVIGRDFRKVRPREHDKKATVRVEYVEALRIAAEPLVLGAARHVLFPGDKRPGSDELIFERLLLTDGAARQDGKSQRSSCRQAENGTPLHCLPPWS